ncbi:MAG TPA: NAD(P)H-dependent oxidoreductase subunit E [Phycisphaerae bacterium]|jgi:NADH-quinone oxidoreductase subunit E|nr:NAD(P)H-dependent oxidoreductase subunit E [Phycisphaerae bacterium]HOB74615.1 NAD(P)H-dependent oxidoreductase subunit E [Phycisphaerae bacterium]HOJ53570.1 NAD(P)H-dependent oxidoreductase subunit E [Phycisphaerae bacterium]HOL25273.1 NAD(P)H-dependent oxidoreductase subunit E [Phycisphaerae bacterium]HPP20512.1 NAD(P)H-dependent oxidoreductase subunit E [Phycisphaerae bacterium]
MPVAVGKPTFAVRRFEGVCRILEEHGYQPSRLIPILQAVQEEYRYLPTEVLTYVATALNLPPARVFGVASFYAHFALAPKGKYVIRLCDGTACHVKRSIPILDALRSRLGLSEQQKTTPDMLFTVETVSCLGACGLAPVLVINDEVHGQMTPERAVALVDAIITKEAQQ